MISIGVPSDNCAVPEAPRTLRSENTVLLRRLEDRIGVSHLLCAHVGPSMNPTLCHLDLLEVAPYGSDPVRIGDIVLFTAPPDGTMIVHRVVSVSTPGIRTRGDNNDRIDPWVLSPDEIIGRVVAAQRGQKRRRVAGAWTGSLAGHVARTTNAVTRTAVRLVHPTWVVLVGWTARLHLRPRGLKPRVVTFTVGGQNEARLFCGSQQIGCYDSGSRRWRIRRRYRLLLDERTLPIPSSGTDAPNITPTF